MTNKDKNAEDIEFCKTTLKEVINIAKNDAETIKYEDIDPKKVEARDKLLRCIVYASTILRDTILSSKKADIPAEVRVPVSTKSKKKAHKILEELEAYDELIAEASEE